MRWLSLFAGVVLIAVAFAAGTRVADTREGLIAEVVTLLAGLVGISLVLYGVFAGRMPAQSTRPHSPAPDRARSTKELTIGAGGLALAVLLIGGLIVSAGWQWGALGLVLLLPMIIGSAYLCGRFLRAR